MIPEELPIAVRAFVDRPRPPSPPQRHHMMRAIGASNRVLVIDTETTTDASQQLRFGVYQLREGDTLAEAGFFYDPDSLTDDELATLRAEADRLGMKLVPVTAFIEEVFSRPLTKGLERWSGSIFPSTSRASPSRTRRARQDDAGRLHLQVECQPKLATHPGQAPLAAGSAHTLRHGRGHTRRARHASPSPNAGATARLLRGCEDGRCRAHRSLLQPRDAR